MARRRLLIPGQAVLDLLAGAGFDLPPDTTFLRVQAMPKDGHVVVIAQSAAWPETPPGQPVPPIEPEPRFGRAVLSEGEVERR